MKRFVLLVFLGYHIVVLKQSGLRVLKKQTNNMKNHIQIRVILVQRRVHSDKKKIVDLYPFKQLEIKSDKL